MHSCIFYASQRPQRCPAGGMNGTKIQSQPLVRDHAPQRSQGALCANPTSSEPLLPSAQRPHTGQWQPVPPPVLRTLFIAKAHYYNGYLL